MRLALLAGGDGWHVRDLKRAAASLGHEAVAIDFRKLSAGVATGRDSFAGFDAVLVRTMPPGSLEQVVFRMDLLHRLVARGIPVVNSPAALETCIDKYLASARLEAAGLPVPATVVCQDADSAIEAFHSLGGDVVVKPLFGSEGRGMMRISDAELAWRTFRTLERTQSVLYLQQFIKHRGWDLRAFVLGGRVLTAMRRHARNGWRTNVAQGARAEPVLLDASQEKLALAAAAAVGVEAAGIDLLPASDGTFFVLEVNAVPGWRALAKATGIDVATEFVRYLQDYRLRLRAC
jgi:ribosomal protein S6--L-glutamate ligase